MGYETYFESFESDFTLFICTLTFQISREIKDKKFQDAIFSKQ